MARKKYSSLDKVPPNIRESLGRFVTNVGGDTFAIHNLPPELTGGVMARYSRAPTGLQLTLVNEFLDEDGNPSQQKGTELMDRVLNSYGDESVRELEGTHVGLENVSQLLTKEIEDRRIGGSPIEQSTRYVKYDQKDKRGRWIYLRPREIIESGFLPRFERANDRAFEVYSEGVKRLTDYFRKEFPREKFSIKIQRDGGDVEVREGGLADDDERRAFSTAYNFTIRAAALDVGRCVLPSSTLTNVGVYGNGRFFSNLLTHLKSCGLEEASERASRLETELKKIIPTFVKRNKVDSRQIEIRKKMEFVAGNLFKGISPESDRVTLVPRGEYIDEVTSSILFPHANISLRQIMAQVKGMSEEAKLGVIEIYNGKRGTRFDRSGRGLEAGYPIVFDLVGGFAEYRDLERHRMLTQQRQKLTTELGFIMPPEISEVGLEEEVEGVLGEFDSLYSDLKHSGMRAVEYATLFNHRMRFMLGMNLREFQHLSELRTQPAGHFSYRSMVMEMAQKLSEEYPFAEKAFQFVDYSDPGNKISRAREQSRIAGKNLRRGIEGDVDY